MSNEPSPVTIVDTVAPVPVVVTRTDTPSPPTVSRAEDLVASPTTTAEEDLVTQGQRRINLIWEVTQAVIAIMITGAVIYCSIVGIKSEILNTAFVLVISMYLVRANHTRVGGVQPGQVGR